jgi:hypothetical protein
MTETIKKLETLFDLTAHPGWKFLTDDLQERIDAIKEGLTHNEVTPYDLGQAQAHVKVFREFLGLRTLVEHAIRQAQEDEADSI